MRSRPWQSSLFRKGLLLAGAIAAAVLFGAASVRHGLRRLRGDSRLIAAAEREAAFAETVDLYAGMVHAGQDEDRFALRELARRCDEHLSALGAASGDAAGAELGRLATGWERLRPALLALADPASGKARADAAFAAVDRDFPPFRDALRRFSDEVAARDRASRRALARTVAGSAAFVIAVLAAALLFAWRGAVEPLSELEEAMRRLDAGQPAARVRAGGDRQLAALADSFNAMTARLDALDRQTRLIFEHSPSLMFLKDAEGRYVLVNRRLEEFLGAPPGGLSGRTLRDFIDVETGADARADDLAALRDGGPVVALERLVVKGETREVLMAKFRVEDPARGALVCGIGTDITDLRRHEAERARMSAVIEHSGLGVLITDPEGVIRHVNSGFERLTGWTRGEAVGRTPSLLKSGRHPAQFYARLWSELRAGRAVECRLTNKRKDGALFVSQSTILPVAGPSGRIENFVGLLRDVTKENELEEEVLHLQKMESVARLAGGIAHDFNNVLAVVLSACDLLAPAVPAGQAASDLEEIRKAGERGGALVRQLMAFSRRQPLERRRLQPCLVLEDMRGMLERLLGASVRLTIDCSRAGRWADADRGQLEQVVMNLAVNARDAMPRGGELRLSVENAEAPAGEAGEWIRLTAADSGEGIPPEVLPRIFEPFFTTKAAGKGTGLGLSTVYGIVTHHGGRIAVDSRVGAGTTFRILLPAVAAAAEPSAAPERGGAGSA